MTGWLFADFYTCFIPRKYLLGEVREKAGMQLGCTWIHTGDVAVMSDVWSGKKSLGEA